MSYHLIDDPLCELDESIPACEDCKDCDYFYDCTEEDNDDCKHMEPIYRVTIPDSLQEGGIFWLYTSAVQSLIDRYILQFGLTRNISEIIEEAATCGKIEGFGYVQKGKVIWEVNT